MKRPSTKTGFALALTVVVSVGLLAATLHWPDAERSRRVTARAANGEASRAPVLETLATLPDELRESSGLAISRTQPGVLWSHNDSGDGPNLYALDQSGRLLATINVTNATARDWEDIASGPCPTRFTARSCLYLADTGNNNRERETLTVYIVVEPTVGGRGEAPSSVEAQSFRYRYPDAPEDAEALAVSPDGDITIVSKGRTGTISFFGISRDGVAGAIASGTELTAEYRGNSGVEPDADSGRLVTAAAVSPDGTTLAVRTYHEIYFYAAAKDERQRIVWHALKRSCDLGDAEPQGEAIDYLDEQTLLLTSEQSQGRPGTIHRVRCS